MTEERMDIDISIEDALLQDALEINAAVPTFGPSEALFSVGFSKERSSSDELIGKMNTKILAHIDAYGYPIMLNTTEAKVDRAAMLRLRMRRCPDPHVMQRTTYTATAGIKQVKAMEYAGFSKLERRSKSAAYAKVSRRYTKLQLAEAEELRQAALLPTINTNIDSEEEVVVAEVTPDGTTQGINNFESDTQPEGERTSWTSAEVGDFLDSNLFYPPTYPIDKCEDPTALTGGTTLHQVINPTRLAPIGNLLTGVVHRRSTQAAHHRRQETSEIRSIRSSVFKAASVLQKTVADGSNSLAAFDQPEKIANMFNNACKMEIISGSEIANAAEKGMAGMSPPRRGRQSSVSTKVFKLFAKLLYTFSAIQQINCGERYARSKLLSKVGSVLNTGREGNGEDPLGDVVFFRRLEVENSRKQVLTPNDPREANRVAWLTYQSQLLNYERWEETAVELGFARTRVESDPDNGESIIWLPGQARRVCNLDEMALFADATIQGGGRPSDIPSATMLPNTSTTAPKGARKVTVIHGINMAGEVMPPYIQFPTDSKDPSKYKLKSSMLLPIDRRFSLNVYVL